MTTQQPISHAEFARRAAAFVAEHRGDQAAITEFGQALMVTVLHSWGFADGLEVLAKAQRDAGSAGRAA